MSFRVAVIGVVLAGLVYLICSFSSPGSCSTSDRSSILAGKYFSGITGIELETILKSQRAEYQWIERSARAPTTLFRGAFEVSVLSVDKLQIAQSIGKARFKFLNNKLMEVVHYPTNFDPSMAQFLIGGTDNPGNPSVESTSCVRVIIGKDYLGASFISWQDVRLTREHDSWILNES